MGIHFEETFLRTYEICQHEGCLLGESALYLVARESAVCCREVKTTDANTMTVTCPPYEEISAGCKPRDLQIEAKCKPQICHIRNA